MLRRLLTALVALLAPTAVLVAVPGPARAAPTPAAAAVPAIGTVPRAPEWPSFLVAGEALCLDELDFNAFARTGRFHTRGSVESCTRLTQLTRVVVLNQAGPKAQVLVVGGPLEYSVGWTNGRLPLATASR